MKIFYEDGKQYFTIESPHAKVCNYNVSNYIVSN